MHFWIASCSAAVGGVIRRWMLNVCPPAFSVATIFGTVPSWCSAISTRPVADGRDAGQLLDLLRLRDRERELRAGEEEVVDEVLPGLPELRQVGDDGAVRRQEVASVAAASAAPERPAAEASVVRLRGARDGEVGADAGQRVERRLLRLVEPVRDRRDRDDERHAEAEAEHRQDRARAAAEELVAHVAEEEHPAEENQRGLRAG